MRFTPHTNSKPSATTTLLSNYQQSQLDHATHLAEVELMEREARREERGMHHRKHSLSVSSKSHRTDPALVVQAMSTVPTQPPTWRMFLRRRPSPRCTVRLRSTSV